MNHRGTHRNSPDLAAIAADWVIRRDAGLNPTEEAEFQRWLAADPRHTAAVATYVQTWSLLEKPRQGGRAAEMVRALAARSDRRRRRIGAAIGGTAVVLAALLFAPRRTAVEAPPPPVAGVPAPPPRIAKLADGSVVDLKNGAEIAVHFDGAFRHITLKGGEALFQVARDPARPFVVTAAGVTIRAVGTAFVVGLERDRVDVIVTEGTVAVANPPPATTVSGRSGPADPEGPPDSKATLVDAGNRLQVGLAQGAAAPAPVSISREEIAHRLGWRETRIEFSRTPLGDAVAQMNRRSKTRLVVDDPELARLPVTGLFRADNTETLVRLLEANFGITAERNGEVITLRRDAAGPR